MKTAILLLLISFNVNAECLTVSTETTSDVTIETFEKYDLDSDGLIGMTDYLMFLQEFGQTGSFADFNNDGYVNLADYTLFISAFSTNVETDFNITSKSEVTTVSRCSE